MDRPHLLHMITPEPNVSPFDVNMAYDAGFDAVIPYTKVSVKDVRHLVQDMIFSRSVNDVKRTAVFICGRDASLALDMLDKAKEAMVPPYEISAFPDPAGSFTTAALELHRPCTAVVVRFDIKGTYTEPPFPFPATLPDGRGNETLSATFVFFRSPLSDKQFPPPTCR